MVCGFALLASLLALTLTSCGGDKGESTGPAFARPALALSPLNPTALNSSSGIDTTSLSSGYVGVSYTSGSRLKFQVICGDSTYNYDLPNDGTPIVCPLSMGSGTYTFNVMQNTSGNRYASASSVTRSVQLADEFQPYIRPDVFCNYNEASTVVAKANELTASAKNQGEALSNIYNYVVSNVKYDKQKAATVADGYVPNPDSTLASGTGICFDYASLTAAMLRSQGIPCKIVTGYVSPDNIYHAWNMVYINGSWKTVKFTVNPNTWTRIDTTFAAGGDKSTVGDGSNYAERYTY